MNPQDFNLVKNAHGQALGLTPDERERFLQQQFPLNVDLRSEVLQLLQWHDAAGEFLTKPFAERLMETKEGEPSPRRLGPYELLRPIGRGGFATVHLARRADLYKQQVAIKVLNHLSLSDADFQRFQREAQILAKLAHPNIVNFIEAGTTGGSISYIVTEFVNGKPIDEFAKPLPQKDKLTLFLKVCDGVFSAHKNLIVHRDIKPSNILVNGDGIPKLLDFGIAILLGQDSRLTETGFDRMSVRYASPEQIRRDRAVTTSTDIFSLGVLLYEMLSGQHPYRGEPHNIQSAILYDDPAPLPAIDRDLAAVVFKALGKTPEQRYESVAHFRDDILRFLEGFPVLAEVGRPWYVVNKFVSRHRLGFAIGALLVALSASAVASVYYQAQRAQRQANRSRELAFHDLASAIDLLWKYPGSLPLSSKLRLKRLEVISDLSDDNPANPELKRELLATCISYASELGYSSAINLGRTIESRKPIQRAVALAEELYRTHPNDPGSTEDLVVSIGYLAANEQDLGHHVVARQLRFRALQLAEDFRTHGEPQTIETDIAYAVAASEAAKVLSSEGNLEQSLKLHKDSVAIRRKVLAGAATSANKQRFSRGLSISLADLAESLLKLKKFDLALQAAEEAVLLERSLYRDDHRHVETRSMYSERLRLKGQILVAAGRSEQALPAIREAVQLERSLLTEDSDNYRNLRILTAGLKVLLSASANLGSHAERRSLTEELVQVTNLAVQKNPALVGAQNDRAFAESLRRQPGWAY